MTIPRWPVAVLGSGNIGTDLMMKILRSDGPLEMRILADLDPASDGLARAARQGVASTADGIDGLLAMPEFADVKIVFDATSANAHLSHWAKLEPTGVRVLDLTPAAVGPFCVPVVNPEQHLDAPNLNLVTCGGQATIPVVAAVSAVHPVRYAEIVSSSSSRSAGPGSLANIDESTETTSAALVALGGAQQGKAVIILNPADPPILMRNTVYCLLEGETDDAAIAASIEAQAERVRAYVPGFRLTQDVQFERVDLHLPGSGRVRGTRVTTLLEVTGAADYLPSHAGNLDIMTTAAVATAARIATAARTEVLA